jgi:hypothetical protein
MQDTDNLNPTPKDEGTLDSNEDTIPEIEEPIVEPAQVEDMPLPDEIIEPAKKEETKGQIFFRKFLRWAVGLLIVFGLGFIVAIFVLYNPTKSNLNQSLANLGSAEQSVNNLQDQVTALESQVASLTKERDGLSSTKQSLESQLDTANAALLTQQEAHQKELQDQQDAFDLRLTILTAREDVSKAQVALYDENPGLARIVITNISDSLDKIEALLSSEYQGAVQPLRDRLQIALDEIGTEPGNAIKDLDILAGDLLELEDALFTK